ncbi:MAG: DUF1858 domain-containing protein [Oscillospiraceae bacterium]|nr:DUF1858 domain-containing protein [Oscillospiraceae bacterium]
MYQVDKSTIVGDVIAHDPYSAEVFYAMGMFCVACPASENESIEMACAVHGIDAEDMVEQLNAYFRETENK